MAITEPSQHASAATIDLSQWDWQAELHRQGRRIPWLARQTDRSLSAVYGYAHGRFPVPQAWLEHAARVLGVEVPTDG